MVQDRDSYYGTLNRNSYALYQMALCSMTLSEPCLPKNHPIFAISYRLSYIFVVDRDTDFKFGRWIDRGKCLLMGGKVSLKGAWLGHVNYLNFGGHQPYLWKG